MKLYVLTLFLVITGAALYGSTTTEFPMDQIRNQIVAEAPALVARTFIIKSHAIDNPDHVIALVYDVVYPLIQNNDIDSDTVRSIVNFLDILIGKLQKKYPKQSAYIADKITNFSFDSIHSYKSVKDVPILNIAIMLMMPNIVKKLLDYGAKPNAVSADGISPLMEAAQYSPRKENVALFITQLLLEHGAKPSLKERYTEKTARDYALQAGNTQVAELLQTAEAQEADKSDANSAQSHVPDKSDSDQ